MPRLNAITPDQATGQLKEIYDDMTAKMGQVSPLAQLRNFASCRTSRQGSDPSWVVLCPSYETLLPAEQAGRGAIRFPGLCKSI